MSLDRPLADAPVEPPLAEILSRLHQRRDEFKNDPYGRAAAYACAIARARPFRQDNLSLAFMAAYVPLSMAGKSFNASEQEVVAIMQDVAAGALGEGELALWLEKMS